MNRIAAVVAGFLLAFVGTSTAFATTWTVCPSGCDYTSIQDAIDASSGGDTIDIHTGTYYEYFLNPNGKAITIQGTRNGDGTLSTIIDAQQGGNVFIINSGEDTGTVIKDLVITGGEGSTDISALTRGGGIYCNASNPTISGCTISYNTARIGAGIYTSDTNLEITDCEISYNTSISLGAGLYCNQNSTVTIENCIISENIAGLGKGGGGGISTFLATLNITASTISNNYCAHPGGGIYCYGGSITINDCMITGNNTGYEFGGGLATQQTSDVNITNSWICDNLPDQTYGPYYESDSCITDDCENCEPDWDGDGVPNDEDQCPGYDDNVDTDDDGTADGCDNCPDISNADQSDDDEDSIGEACDNCPGEANNDQADDDEDSVGDACDQCPGEDDTIDTDLDGTPNCIDNCPNDQFKTEPGECGCGIPDTDSDKDDTPDCHDNCPNDPFKTEPGNCGCGVAETTTFGDLDCDGDYDIDDAYAAMANFGIDEAGECAGDTNNDGVIDIEDLLNMLSNFGSACP
ncbi:MAG: right-handed parallel beta-helix repeat-containing protein [Planctomycetota bacterium]|nr:right-handed parallel beta-helix repeat-containing protein [Planctomycetota bacterium]